jgi:hypothetical protein
MMGNQNLRTTLSLSKEKGGAIKWIVGGLFYFDFGCGKHHESRIEITMNIIKKLGWFA